MFDTFFKNITIKDIRLTECSCKTKFKYTNSCVYQSMKVQHGDIHIQYKSKQDYKQIMITG